MIQVAARFFHKKLVLTNSENAVAVLLAWSIFSVFLSTGPQYVFSVFLLAWFLATKGWKDLKNQNLIIFGNLAKGVLVFLGLSFISGLLGWVFTNNQPIGAFLYDIYHLTGKLGVRGLFLVAYLFVAAERKLLGAVFGKVVLGLVLINSLYLVTQALTGIDWVHGFGTILPPNRFNYGVFRTSGFVGHPLNLGYNALLAGSLALVMLQNFRSLAGKLKVFWLANFALCLLTLVLTQARWPLFVLLGLVPLGILLQKRPLKFKLTLISIGLACSLGILATNSGLKGRVGEVLDGSRPIAERVPRLVFWEVHWKMIQDQPWLGIGLASRNSRLLDYYDKAGYTNNDRKYSAHNIYLQTLADSGIVGFVGLLGLLAYPLLHAFRQLRNGDHGLLIFMTGVLLAGMMQNIFRDSEFIFGYWVVLALVLSRHRWHRIREPQGS